MGWVLILDVIQPQYWSNGVIHSVYLLLSWFPYTYLGWWLCMPPVCSSFWVPTKLGHVGHDHRLSLSQPIPYVNPSFFLGTSPAIFSVQILVLLWTFLFWIRTGYSPIPLSLLSYSRLYVPKVSSCGTLTLYLCSFHIPKLSNQYLVIQSTDHKNEHGQSCNDNYCSQNNWFLKCSSYFDIISIIIIISDRIQLANTMSIIICKFVKFVAHIFSTRPYSVCTYSYMQTYIKFSVIQQSR